MNKEQFKKDMADLIEARIQFKQSNLSREIFDSKIQEVLNKLSKEWDAAHYEEEREEIWDAAYSVLELQGHDSDIIIDSLRMSLR